MGAAAAEMLMEKTADPARALAPRVLPVALAQGQTAAPPRGENPGDPA
jgi:hypothetical protein